MAIIYLGMAGPTFSVAFLYKIPIQNTVTISLFKKVHARASVNSQSVNSIGNSCSVFNVCSISSSHPGINSTISSALWKTVGRGGHYERADREERQ